RANPRRRPWWPNLVLFIITIFSVLWVGTMLDVQMMGAFHAQQILNNLPFELWRGIPYAASILLILGSHELGHYFAARRHNLAVTLPYFIPVPPLVSLFGTLGAFIQLREPMRNRKVLLDVGMAGPLAGLVFAVPILFIGLAHMTPQPVTSLGGIYEGDSILYAAAKTLTYGHFVPDGRTDICITCNQLAWAGWTGLLVTALNLMPIGQLDGGHILYALIGERARKLYYPLLGVMIGLVLVTRIWMLWVLLLLLFGRIYATPLDMITPLDKRRRWLAIFSLVVFILVFVPTPLTEIAAPAASPPPSGNSVYQLPFNPFS
ncbi:MAG: site-2 protease family protein, partial [Anaerolineae bacterium]|nr:site-2 protease family protein [Anaerolineae bacterium]